MSRSTYGLCHGLRSPDQASGRPEAWTVDGVFVDGELMPQGKVFQAERGPGPEQRADKSEQSSENRWHGWTPHLSEAVAREKVRRSSVLVRRDKVKGLH